MELRLVAYQVEPICNTWCGGVYRIPHVGVRGLAPALCEGVVPVPFGLGRLVRVKMGRDASTRDGRLRLVEALAD